MGDFFMNEEVDELGQIRFALHDFQVSHFCVDEFTRNSVKVDFDGALRIFVTYISGLNQSTRTL